MPKKEDIIDGLWVIGILISAGISFLILYELSYMIWPEGTLGP